MELKRFVGSDSKAAMEQVRAHYGDEALIISTNKVGNKTEMICAVEEPRANAQTNKAVPAHGAQADEGLDISEATSTVASLLNRVAADAAAEGLSGAKSSEQPGLNAGRGVSRIAKEFGQELNSALSDQRSSAQPQEPTASARDQEEVSSKPFMPARSSLSGRDDMHAMMQTIQQDLAQLRSQLETQAAAAAPIRQAQLAMASINKRMAQHASTASEPARQIETLIGQPISLQRDWAGTHAFIGQPGVGKTTAIATVTQQLVQQNPDANVIVLSLLPATEPESELGPLRLTTGNAGLAQLCQRMGIVFLEANDQQHLGRLLNRYRQDNHVFIDTSASQLDDEQGLINLIADNEVLPHLCVGADMSPSTLDRLAKRIPWIVSSVILTRFDLVPDLDGLLNSLDACSAKISGLSGYLIDTPADADEKGNSTNTLDE
jgi:flagellar biosynthesis GTPase FlhF